MTDRKFKLNIFLISGMLLLALALSSAASHAATGSDLNATGQINSYNGAFLRAKASTSGKKLAGLDDNTPVIINKEVFVTKKKSGAKKKWYYVKAGNKKGYVRSDLVKNIQYGTAKGTAKTKIYYRAGAGSSMKKKGKFNKNKTFTIVLDAKAKGTSRTWYKVKQGSKYYYISSAKVKVSEVAPAVTALPSSAEEPVETGVPEQSDYALKVVSGACSWAVKIANDNSFHYGNGKHSRHNGCFYCGTQPPSKKKYVTQWEKTYCCNPFITAAYAHGGNEPTMYGLCSRGKSWMAPEFRKSDLFYNMGHPAKSELKKGDILCTSIHVAMYIGDGKLVEAATADDGKPGSSKWNSSIRVANLTDSRYKGFNNGVFRYIGTEPQQQ